MTNPITVYIDSVDVAAYDKAQSGKTIYPKTDYPFFPIIAPWLIGGPLLAFLPSGGIWAMCVGSITLMLSIGGYAGFGIFFTRRVLRYRRELGVEVKQSFW
jgi:hypothetical protein